MAFLDRLTKFLEQPKIVSEMTTNTNSSTFNKAIQFILEVEGGYVNDFHDPGGETKYGISKKAFPELDIKNLSIDEAKEIYYKQYWLGSGAKVENISSDLAIIIFDTAVNMGVATSIKILQRVLRVQEDGVFGVITENALRKGDIEQIIQWYITNRFLRYTSLNTWTIYKNGWINRIVRLLRYVGRGG
jgi:lysozyme family protein